jgi:metal-responsive CopG/Arc/MetJ family transcriptional regulator
MAERLHRTQILLEPAQHRALTEIAQRQQRSVSEVVREIVQEKLAAEDWAREKELQDYLVALERIRQHRETILAERGGQPIDFDVVAAIHQARREQDEKNTGIIINDSD